MQFLGDLISLSERLGVISPHESLGCTEQEIKILEGTLNINLPRVYKEFLLWIGKSQIWFMGGSQWQCYEDDLILLQDDAKEVLNEKYFLDHLPINAYVFWLHLDYHFYFFLLTEGENPPIYMFLEGETVGTFRKEFCSFTDFLEYEILAHYLIKNKSVPENRPLIREYYRPCKSSVNE